MSLDDGRLVSNFAVAALKGEPLQIYGDGQATRSLMVGQECTDSSIARCVAANPASRRPSS